MGGEARRSRGWIWWFIALALAALVVTAAVLTIRKRSGGGRHRPDVMPVPGPPGEVVEKYSTALVTALQFFEVQKCNFFFFFKICCWVWIIAFGAFLVCPKF